MQDDTRGNLNSGGRAAYARKRRPAIIVQDDRFDAIDSIIVGPLTTDPTTAPTFRLPVQPTAENGLQVSCCLMVDKLTAVSRARLEKRVRALTREEMKALNRAMFVFLGLAGNLVPTLAQLVRV